MDIFAKLQQLFTKSKFASQQLNISYTPIEHIQYPDTYSNIGFYATIPEVPANPLSGIDIEQQIFNLTGQYRENIILQHCLNGNIPNFMRTFKTIVISDNINTLQLYVSQDVLCVGTDIDYLRVPTYPHTARQIADYYYCMLPTKKIADLIWKNADLKLNPEPIPPWVNMSSTSAFIHHNQMIESQIQGRVHTLLTGHKKDIIIDKQLLTYKNNVGIYGWFYPSGIAIQGPGPNCTSHDKAYEDYSHGVRLVAQVAFLNNHMISLYEVLNNPQYAYLISDEGYYDAFNIYK